MGGMCLSCIHVDHICVLYACVLCTCCVWMVVVIVAFFFAIKMMMVIVVGCGHHECMLVMHFLCMLVSICRYVCIVMVMV